ncbi:trypsin-1-like isoform X2 [Zootermopsis nevadensis]|nr:trypsin-1-like isoform X2 [Zootermopsis nevadensis]
MPCTLQRAYIQIFTNRECNELELPSNIPSPRILCAGVIGGGVDSCLGDSGGPLQVVDNGMFVLTGIVSFGFGCGKVGYPGIYTNVYYFLDWIKENT